MCGGFRIQGTYFLLTYKTHVDKNAYRLWLEREKTEYETEIAKANLDAITKGIKMREEAGLMPDITSGLGVELQNSGSLWKETIDSITKGDFKQAAPALLGLVLKMGIR